MAKISEAIKNDHRDLDDAYNKISQATTHDDKTRWRNQFVWELARHSIGEELVLYPAFERLLPNGKEMADKDRKDHLTLKEELYKLQDLDPAKPDFQPTLDTLMKDLREHIKEEEEHDLVALEDRLAMEDSESMVKSFERTKMFVPSRSHPSAPDKPPFETAAGMLAAPIDHIMDLFRKFPKDSKSEMPP